MQDVDQVRAAFTDPEEFWSSPLYRELSAVVAADPYLLGVAAHTRAGQVPTFAFFAAVHALLLAGAEHPLAEYFVSVRGSAARPPGGAGPALLSFVHDHEEQITATVASRYVQTNHVRRAVALRLALATVAPTVGERPAHLLEIGCSAGLILRQEHYGYRLGGRTFGDRVSAVQLTSQWRSERPVPDLDHVPALSSVTGVDLHPIDPAADVDRRWLEALVWPEDRDKAALLHDALALAARTPVTTVAGDAVTACPAWSAALPRGDVRIVFHCATRMHVPADRRDGFDAAIDAVAEDGPLVHVAVEGDGIQIAEPGGEATRRFDCDGHLAWAAPA